MTRIDDYNYIYSTITYHRKSKTWHYRNYNLIESDCYRIISVYLADPFALYCECLHLAEVVVVCGHICNDGLLIRLINIHIWRK